MLFSEYYNSQIYLSTTIFILFLVKILKPRLKDGALGFDLTPPSPNKLREGSRWTGKIL